MSDDDLDPENVIRVLQIPRDQAERLRVAMEAGWRFETDLSKIRARYTDLDLADQVPRAIMYVDLGVLFATIDNLTAFLVKEGYRFPERK